MRKTIFLEYKFGDYDTKTLYASGANEVVAWMERLNPTRFQQLQNWHIKINFSFGGFDDSICPLNPKSRYRLGKLIKQAIKFGPSGIIIDHFRFAGRWEVKKQGLESPHLDCKYCQGKSRGKELVEIAMWIRSQVPRSIELGYYAVPFESEKITVVGQDHKLLGEIFDYICPMLYHRMIDKPVEYIYQFTKYLSDLTGKSVIPAIAVKDMPDELPDQISESILKQEYEQAVKYPSAGICWFSWDGTIEKHKTGIIGKIWK